MSRVGKGKKAVPLPKKKDAATAARKAMNKEAEDSNAMMTRLEEDHKQRKQRCYTPHNSTVSNKMKSMINKLMGKDKPKKIRKTTPCPVLGAALKYHNDDNMDDYTDDDDDVDPAADAVGAA